MPLAFHVFSVVLFLIGGLLTVFEGTSFADMAREVPENTAMRVSALAVTSQSVKGIAVGAAPCMDCRTRGHTINHIEARPVRKPSRLLQAADRYNDSMPGDTIPSLVFLSEAQWDYALAGDALAPAVSFDPEFGFLRSSMSRHDVSSKAEGYAIEDTYRVQPAVLGSYAQDGFRLYGVYGTVDEGADACWTEKNYDPAGRAWSPDACRPSVLQAEEEIDPLVEPLRSPYRVGFTTKIRHSVVGLRISRKLN